MTKLKSRTFWFASVWTLFVPIGLIVQVSTDVVIPLGELILMAGSIVTVYIGGNKIVKNTSIKTEEDSPVG